MNARGRKAAKGDKAEDRWWVRQVRVIVGWRKTNETRKCYLSGVRYLKRIDREFREKYGESA